MTADTEVTNLALSVYPHQGANLVCFFLSHHSASLFTIEATSVIFVVRVMASCESKP